MCSFVCIHIVTYFLIHFFSSFSCSRPPDYSFIEPKSQTFPPNYVEWDSPNVFSSRNSFQVNIALILHFYLHLYLCVLCRLFHFIAMNGMKTNKLIVCNIFCLPMNTWNIDIDFSSQRNSIPIILILFFIYDMCMSNIK